MDRANIKGGCSEAQAYGPAVLTRINTGQQLFITGFKQVPRNESPS